MLVGVSLNLTKILAYPNLPSRAFEPFVLLLNVLIVSSVLLVPDQPPLAMGVEMLVVAVIAVVMVILLQRNRWKTTELQYRRSLLAQSIFSFAATLPFVIAGLIVMSGDVGGVYWVVPGVALTYVNIFIGAWVLLVEINR
ncbi:MAG: hypothetical protein U0521_11640 [Anaerolineae bacterium]